MTNFRELEENSLFLRHTSVRSVDGHIIMVLIYDITAANEENE